VTVAVRIRDYSQLTQALAARRRQLGLRQLEVDELSSLPSGYQGKIEACCRSLGKLSLPMILAALDCDLYLGPRRADEDLTQRDRTGSAGRVYHAKLQPEGEPEHG